MARQPWGAGQPRQAQTLAATLAAYTRDAAYAEFQEDVKGQLRAEALLADLTLLSGDLGTIHNRAAGRHDGSAHCLQWPDRLKDVYDACLPSAERYFIFECAVFPRSPKAARG